MGCQLQVSLSLRRRSPESLIRYPNRALLNLDSAGAGGRDLLFQGGPNHPWLMEVSSPVCGAKNPPKVGNAIGDSYIWECSDRISDMGAAISPVWLLIN